MMSNQHEQAQPSNKDNDDKSMVMAVVTNTTMTHNMHGATKLTAMKLASNPWKMVNNGCTSTTSIPINTTPLPKDFPFTTWCCLCWWHVLGKKTSKNNYCLFITEFLTLAATIDNTITIFKFFSINRTPPQFPTSPLQTPFQLPMDLGYLCYYFPSQAPEALLNAAVMMYIGYTSESETLSACTEVWLKARNATWTATTIQSEHAKDLCWFVYSTKTPTAMTSVQHSPNSWGKQ